MQVWREHWYEHLCNVIRGYHRYRTARTEWLAEIETINGLVDTLMVKVPIFTLGTYIIFYLFYTIGDIAAKLSHDDYAELKRVWKVFKC